jgi:predicted nucleic acid-binding protein
MVIYFDMCCLKRPFDDQTQPRIAMETAAVVALQQAVDDHRLRAVRSATHDVENARNPDRRRASAVAKWLSGLNSPLVTPVPVAGRIIGLANTGFKALDAAHIAWAEHLNADVFVTVDDDLLRKAKRISAIMVRMANPVDLVQELGL